jgi:hypothetical protein
MRARSTPMDRQSKHEGVEQSQEVLDLADCMKFVDGFDEHSDFFLISVAAKKPVRRACMWKRQHACQTFQVVSDGTYRLTTNDGGIRMPAY